MRAWTPRRAAELTGIAADEIVQLAREYATTRPAALRMNYGVQRSENGGTAVRAIAMLPALTGAWKYRGGGAQLSTSGAFAWNKQADERPDLALASPIGRLARVVNAESPLGTLVIAYRCNNLILDGWRGFFMSDGEDRNGPA